MFVSREGSDVCVGIIQKCANTSIRSAVMMSNIGVEIQNKDAFDYDKRVAFVRDPLERLDSAFSHFWFISSVGSSFDDMPVEHLYVEGRGLQGDYEAFIDYILGNENCHWIPQVDILSYEGVFVPNIIYKLSNIKDVWENYFTGYLPWENAWSKQKVKPYRIDDLKEYYKLDLKLWDSL